MRGVTLDEALAFAAALGVPLAHLLPTSAAPSTPDPWWEEYGFPHAADQAWPE